MPNDGRESRALADSEHFRVAHWVEQCPSHPSLLGIAPSSDLWVVMSPLRGAKKPQVGWGADFPLAATATRALSLTLVGL